MKYINKAGEIKIYDKQSVNKKYYEKNKEAIKAKVFYCDDCKKSYLLNNKSNHYKTKKHINNNVFIENP
jgi:hypothetical protein